jgi:hypothetical protein
MTTVRNAQDLKKVIKSNGECGNFVTPKGPGNCCNKGNTGYCCIK